jgi:hypothetical protein
MSYKKTIDEVRYKTISEKIKVKAKWNNKIKYYLLHVIIAVVTLTLVGLGFITGKALGIF